MSDYRGCPMCGVIDCPRANEAPTIPTVPSPHEGTVVDHLHDHHGMSTAVLATAEPVDLMKWHAAEHRTRTPQTNKQGDEKGRHAGHLRHLHPTPEQAA